MSIKIEELTPEETKKFLENLPKSRRGKYDDITKSFEKLPVGGSTKVILNFSNEKEYKHACSVAGHLWNKFSKTGKAEVTRTTVGNSIIVLITKKTRGE